MGSKTAAIRFVSFIIAGFLLIVFAAGIFPFILPFDFSEKFRAILSLFLFIIFIYLNSVAFNAERFGAKEENRADLLKFISILNSEMNFVIYFFCILGNIKEQENNEKLNQKYEDIQGKMEIIKIALARYEVMERALRKKKDVDAKEIKDGLEEIKEKLKGFQTDMAAEVNDFAQIYIQNKNLADKNKLHMTTLIYYLAVSIPILSDFTKIFNEFSKEIILEVINKFDDITYSSHQIAANIEISMNSLMDETREDSLGFILKKAHNLVADFETFYLNIERLKNTSDSFVKKTNEKLQSIQNIAVSIGEIAETIKVLSLNVGIEAANAGSTGKAFQVLARNLREFAGTTMKFALEVKNRVKDAFGTSDNLKNNYIESMDKVAKTIDGVKLSIESFETIIQASFNKIKLIIEDLRKFSDHIDIGIKSVIGRLQYYDIVSQEVDHLKIFIEKMFYDLFNNKMVHIDVNETLSQEEKQLIKRDVLRMVNEIITTADERKILEKYENVFGIKLHEKIDIENKASQDIKGKKEDIILF
jgi:methyl-accepting chemotaxis protein